MSVIGVGHPLRGDDAAGLEIASRLRREPNVAVRSHAGEGVDLLDLWEGADALILVDTVRSGAPPGTIHRFDVSETPLPGSLRRPAGHAVSVAEAIELARQLGRLPARAMVVGIEGQGFETGGRITSEVDAALDALAAVVRAEARGALETAART